nr:MFS transporter [Roseospira goensis]
MGGIIAALHVGKVPPALPALRTELGLDLIPAGFVVSTFNVLGMSLGLATGVVADRLGRRRLVGLGLACLAGGGTLGATSAGFPLLLASRVLEGLGFMAVSVASPALVLAATAPRDRPLALSLWSVFMPAGMALAMVAAPLALDVVGWRGLWWTIAALAAAGIGAVLAATRGLALHAPPAGPSRRALLESLRRPALLLLAGTFGAYAFQWIALMVWLPTFLPAAFGVEARTAALLTALVVVMNVPGNLLGGWLLRRGLPASRVILVAALGMALCATGLILPVLPDPLRFALVLLFSGTGGLIPAALFATVPGEAPSPRHMAAANGLLMQGSNIGQFLGPPVVAAAVTAAGGAWTGALGPMVTAAALAAGAAVLGARLPAPARPSP